ncbi:hypothetical protein ES319_A01G108000v1 [Gossypium barbadense]|uniref:Uncharacterized protein n=1 Tax=Gossypium barbadense TaxID=3634 RepID=A0A5J5WUH1_GOSBA|nr:hypothetical protein ES319_A01G108000v1 [Gossypium barbadense]
MVVEIVSKEFIKPTPPTPHHLRTHLLSILDQFLPSIYVPMVLFYMDEEKSIPAATSNSRRLQLLKESLSETLTLFYPLVGRINDHLSIDYNDEGAYYIDARVNHPLREFLNHIDSSYVSQVFLAEVTTFAYGGISLGSFLSNIIFDEPAAITFISSWAALTCKCGEEAGSPNFDSSFVFPQSVAYLREATFSAIFSPFLKKGICRSMRITFDASATDLLKVKTTSSSVRDPTRVGVVSAVLCKCNMATFKVKSGIQKSTLITHVVNLFQRVVPQFSKHSMGNFLCMEAALVRANETGLDNLVFHLRKVIRKADGNFVTALQGDGGWLKFSEYIKEIGKEWNGEAGEIDFIGFTSWCNFGLYEIDFGWGKPTWVTCTASTKSEAVFMNTIVLIDTKMENGIEACVFLEEQYMVC